VKTINKATGLPLAFGQQEARKGPKEVRQRKLQNFDSSEIELSSVPNVWEKRHKKLENTAGA